MDEVAAGEDCDNNELCFGALFVVHLGFFSGASERYTIWVAAECARSMNAFEVSAGKKGKECDGL